MLDLDFHPNCLNAFFESPIKLSTSFGLKYFFDCFTTISPTFKFVLYPFIDLIFVIFARVLGFSLEIYFDTNLIES